MNQTNANKIFEMEGSKLFNDSKQIEQETVIQYIEYFEEKKETDEKTVQTVFDTFKNNDDVNQVLIKVIVLNNRYSAGLTDWKPSSKNIDVLSMANSIVELNKKEKFSECKKMDTAREMVKKLSIVDKEMVKALTNVDSVNSGNPLSFASKYCAWTWKGEEWQPPIIDSYVAGLLYYVNNYLENDSRLYSEKLTQEDIKEYDTFCKVYDSFVERYKMREIIYQNYPISNKQIDEFLWQYAKGKNMEDDPIRKNDNNEKESIIKI